MVKFKNVGPDVNAVRRADLGGPLVNNGDELEVEGELVKPPAKKQLADAGLEAPEGLVYHQVGTQVVGGKEVPRYELVPDDAYYVEHDGDVRAFPKSQWEPVAQKSSGPKASDESKGD